MTTDISTTRDTTGVVGNAGEAPVGTAATASIRDTTVMGGGGGGDNNKTATEPDTEGFGAGTSPYGVGSDPDDGTLVSDYEPLSVYSQQAVSGTLDTGSGGGSPIQQVDPDYRAPADYSATGTVYDTTRTDTPISDGTDRDSTAALLSGNRDTVNPTVTLQTTTTNVPVAPATPTVAAGERSVTVTWVAVAVPAGAHVRGYRIEGSTGGVDFGGAADTSIVISNLVPSQSYKFRVAAFNDNGESAFSAFSAAAIPLNPDEPGPGHATTLDPANTAEPIYKPDGTTTGVPGPVRSLTAVITATAGQVQVDWLAPAWGTAPTGYRVTASSGETADVSAATFTKLLTGLTFAGSTPVTVTVIPLQSVVGNGRALTSARVAPTGPPATAVAAATLVTGELKVDVTAPLWGVPTGYTLLLSTGETYSLTSGLTHTFTGLSSVSRTCKVTPFNASGNGVPKISNAATALP